MRALDPRLLRYARATRWFLYTSVALGSLGALLIVAQAWLLADVVARAFIDGQSLARLRAPMTALLALVLARALLAWAAELVAARSSARAKSQLRAALLARLPALGSDASRRDRTGELTILATRGIDALDSYFALYLPQLLLAAIVPVVVVIAIASGDWISAAIVALTIPLIPLFMALVGAATSERMDRQLHALERLAGHFLDVVAGLPTLKVFGRARAQTARIRESSERYRRAALETLRVTFLSSLVLELLATIAVALVAVAIGLRLMDGHLGLRTALFALVLAPEAYLPLRRLGANYHAGAEGAAAAEQIFALLERPSRAHSTSLSSSPPILGGVRGDVPDPARVDITIEGLRFTYPDRPRPALADVSLTVSAGETLALVGPSGAGKSTLLGLLLGLLEPNGGSIRVGERELSELDRDAWRAGLAWVPQRPHLFNASLAGNVRVGRTDATEQDVQAALADAGLAEVVAGLPAGVHTVLGEHGAGLSAGERQRLALARAFVRNPSLLLLDEPTASLDGDTEREIVRAIARLARGRTVLLVAHRPALVAMADRVVSLVPAAVAA